MAYSECSPTGQWFDSALKRPYTHYSQCPDVAGFQVRRTSINNSCISYCKSYDFFQTSDTINKIYVAGYSVSIVFLAVATFIFIHFRFVNRRQDGSQWKVQDLSIVAKRLILAFKICELSLVSGHSTYISPPCL